MLPEQQRCWLNQKTPTIDGHGRCRYHGDTTGTEYNYQPSGVRKIWVCPKPVKIVSIVWKLKPTACCTSQSLYVQLLVWVRLSHSPNSLILHPMFSFDPLTHWSNAAANYKTQAGQVIRAGTHIPYVFPILWGAKELIGCHHFLLVVKLMFHCFAIVFSVSFALEPARITGTQKNVHGVRLGWYHLRMDQPPVCWLG